MQELQNTWLPGKILQSESAPGFPNVHAVHFPENKLAHCSQIYKQKRTMTARGNLTTQERLGPSRKWQTRLPIHYSPQKYERRTQNSFLEWDAMMLAVALHEDSSRKQKWQGCFTFRAPQSSTVSASSTTVIRKLGVCRSSLKRRPFSMILLPIERLGKTGN